MLNVSYIYRTCHHFTIRNHNLYLNDQVPPGISILANLALILHNYIVYILADLAIYLLNHKIVLVDSGNGFERDFTIGLK